MKLCHLHESSSTLYLKWPTPSIIVFYLGGNDIGSRKILDIISQVDFLQLHSLFFRKSVLAFGGLYYPSFNIAIKFANKLKLKITPTVKGVSYCQVDLEGNLPVFFRSHNGHLSQVALDVFNLGLLSCVELASVCVGCQTHYMWLVSLACGTF